MDISKLLEEIRNVQKEYLSEDIDLEISFNLEADLENKRMFKRTTHYEVFIDVVTEDVKELRYSLINELKNILEDYSDISYSLTIYEYTYDKYSDYGYNNYCIDFYTNGDCLPRLDVKEYEHFNVLKQEKGVFNELNNDFINLMVKLDTQGNIDLQVNEKDLFSKVKSFNDFAKSLGVDMEYKVSDFVVTLKDFENQLKDINDIEESIIEFNNLEDKPYKLDTWLIYDTRDNSDNSGFYITLESHTNHPHYYIKDIDISNFLVSVNLLTRGYWISGISPYTDVVLREDKNYYYNSSIYNNNNSSLALKTIFNDICLSKLPEIFTETFIEINLTKLKKLDFLDVVGNVEELNDKTIVLSIGNEQIARIKLPDNSKRYIKGNIKPIDIFTDLLEYLWKH